MATNLYALQLGGVNQVVYVHRLVYEAFKGEIPKELEIDHIDRNKHNNNPDNLRLVTRAENCQNRKYTNRKYTNSKYTNDFSVKFREHYGIKDNECITHHPDYIKNYKWYRRHKTFRWEHYK